MEFRYSITATRAAESTTDNRFAPERRQSSQPQYFGSASEGALVALCLAFLALAVHGYHPYAEDGGLYFSAILKVMRPELFPSWSGFFTAPMRFSLFAPAVSMLTRASGLPLAVMIFLLHIVSLWATIFGAWLIAGRCFASRYARYGAASLLALCLTLPIAGTSLILMDPYVTARSFSTPLGLFALAAMIDLTAAIRSSRPVSRRSAFACLICIAAAALVHPLMAGYTLGCLLLLLACSQPDRKIRLAVTAGLCFTAVATAACLFHFGMPLTADYARVARTRQYWFLQEWHWYEILGLIGPLLVLDRLSRDRALPMRESARWLAQMTVPAGLTAIVISLVFVHETSHTYEIAQLQPLRIFHLIYIVMIISLGALAGERILATSRWRWTTMFLVFCAAMFYVQQQTFPASAHIELPWKAPHNAWEQAFLWAKQNTPQDALFALDANYINEAGEDAQYFNAISERSALPDTSKDAGLAAIAPQLASGWMAAQAPITGLDHQSDAQRMAGLRPFSVMWIVLPTGSPTALPCPYSNSVAKVCRLLP